MKLFIKNELLTLNEYINIERGNKFKAAKVKKINTMVCKAAARRLTNINPYALYDVKVTWNVTNKKKDPDNIFFGVKFILDGLVNAGVIKNDGRKNIRHISHEIYDSKMYFIIVELIKVDQI